MRVIKKIVVHVSDSPDVVDVGAKEIRSWHMQKGWSDIGYHKVVRRSGEIEDGRPEDISGAHVKGHNYDSLGIVWVGKRDCKPEQKASLKKQIYEWMGKHGLSVSDVYGHYEFDPNKTCPNLDMDQFRQELKDGQNGITVSSGTKEHLPNGPSETDIDVTLEDIENQIIRDED